jgi:hypothetical protein
LIRKPFAVILPQRPNTLARSAARALATSIHKSTTDADRVIRERIEDRLGLWAWRDRVRREFKPVEWSEAARAVLKGLDTTEEALNAAEQLRRRA